MVQKMAMTSSESSVPVFQGLIWKIIITLQTANLILILLFDI